MPYGIYGWTRINSIRNRNFNIRLHCSTHWHSNSLNATYISCHTKSSINNVSNSGSYWQHRF